MCGTIRSSGFGCIADGRRGRRGSRGCIKQATAHWHLCTLSKASHLLRRREGRMNSVDKILGELESKRKAMNERLMNARTIVEANKIERELWAERAAMRNYRSMGNGMSGSRV